jgi:putative FmdB family regulatory protein
MPYYDLKCNNCGNEFNAAAKMSERESRLIKCPECSNTDLDAVFSKVNIIRSNKKDKPEDRLPACPNFEKCGGCCRYS